MSPAPPSLRGEFKPPPPPTSICQGGFGKTPAGTGSRMLELTRSTLSILERFFQPNDLQQRCGFHPPAITLLGTRGHEPLKCSGASKWNFRPILGGKIFGTKVGPKIGHRGLATVWVGWVLFLPPGSRRALTRNPGLKLRGAFFLQIPLSQLKLQLKFPVKFWVGFPHWWVTW